MESTIILNHEQILRKIKRLAWQIFENNMELSNVFIGGIDQRGQFIAHLIANELKSISNFESIEFNVELNRETFEPTFSIDINQFQNQRVIIVDDVMNSGKTTLHCLIPIVKSGAAKLELLVLASRSHRKYPIKPDYVGISMATTIQEHLLFDISNKDNITLTLS